MSTWERRRHTSEGGCGSVTCGARRTTLGRLGRRLELRRESRLETQIRGVTGGDALFEAMSLPETLRKGSASARGGRAALSTGWHLWALRPAWGFHCHCNSHASRSGLATSPSATLGHSPRIQS